MKDVSRYKQAFKQSPFDIIDAGCNVDIKIYSKNDYGETYKSKVLKFVNEVEKVIAIYIPILHGAPLDMENDILYLMTVHGLDCSAKFKCELEGYFKEETGYFIAIKILDEGIIMQRREFFRFTCMLAMKFSILYSGDNEAAKLLEDAGYNKMYSGISRDIGAGGIRFITKEELEVNNLIQCIIMLNNNAVMLKGRLLEKQYMPKSALKFQYRVAFVDIQQSTQEEIVNYIFAEQRKQRKRKTAENE